MKIVIFGLSITSSWGNGHATTFRALARALHARGHRIVFFEKNVEWYASNRDLPEPGFCELKLYTRWRDVLPTVRRELASADVAMVGSYFPDGIAAMEAMLDSRATVRTFYDIDTPITVAMLREQRSNRLCSRRSTSGLGCVLQFYRRVRCWVNLKRALGCGGRRHCIAASIPSDIGPIRARRDLRAR